MTDVIYNSNWYALPVEQQKDLKHLMNRTQNGPTLSIGPFSTINRECFYAVSSFYSRSKCNNFCILKYKRVLCETVCSLLITDDKQDLLVCYVSTEFFQLTTSGWPFGIKPDKC